MWSFPWVKLLGVCGGSLRTHPHPLTSCLTLRTPYTALPHTLSTSQYSTHTYCSGQRRTSTDVYSHLSPHRRIGGVAGRGSRRGCEWDVRGISTAAPLNMFWEQDPKAGYKKKIKKSRKELIRDGLKQMRLEMIKWKEEVKEDLKVDPVVVMPGDMDKVWVLNSKEVLDQWVVTCDSDHGEGSSTASLELSPMGHGLFSGHINTEVIKDGQLKKAGYCNIRSIRPRKSFQREVYYDWTQYNTLEIRLRGDGRSYMLNIATTGFFDLMWNDIYSYPLYTRGGPHWQLTRIPFSKFYLNSRGRMQDKQYPIPLDRVVSVGITAGDRSNAPFRLEIDYIGLYVNPDHDETFAYEMYRHNVFTLTP